MVKQLQPQPQPGGNVLELGAGTGDNAELPRIWSGRLAAIAGASTKASESGMALNNGSGRLGDSRTMKLFFEGVTAARWQSCDGQLPAHGRPSPQDRAVTSATQQLPQPHWPHRSLRLEEALATAAKRGGSQ